MMTRNFKYVLKVNEAEIFCFIFYDEPLGLGNLIKSNRKSILFKTNRGGGDEALTSILPVHNFKSSERAV